MFNFIGWAILHTYLSGDVAGEPHHMKVTLTRFMSTMLRSDTLSTEHVRHHGSYSELETNSAPYRGDTFSSTLQPDARVRVLTVTACYVKIYFCKTITCRMGVNKFLNYNKFIILFLVAFRNII